jgi:hypothetical protein
MNTTIAVALITALSTLAGASTTGYLGLLISRAQLKTQQKSAELERGEQHAKDVREIRRDVYLSFMNQLTRIEELFDRDLWIRTGFGEDGAISPGEIMYTATAMMHQLAARLDLVRLEGPYHVSEAALKLYSGLNKEMMRLMLLSSQEAPEIVKSKDEMYALWKKASEAREEAKAEFIKVASDALEALAGIELSPSSSTAATA